jgi:hypothetical protein
MRLNVERASKNQTWTGAPTLSPLNSADRRKIEVGLKADVYLMYGSEMSTATFTELLRKPKDVLAHIDEGQVRITRRDGDDLVILRGHDLDVLERGVALSSRLLRAIGRNRGDVEAALTELFAWTVEFNSAELAAYAAEIEKLVYTASELGAFGRLLRAQREWEETARAYALGMRAVEIGEVPGVPVRVSRP